MCYNSVKIHEVEKELVGKIYKASENVTYLKPVVIPQQVPCRRYLNPSCVTEPVVSMVNFICFHGF